MISLLITLIIVVIVVGVLFWILSMLPIPQPWLNVAKVLIALVLLIWLLSYLVPFAGHPILR